MAVSLVSGIQRDTWQQIASTSVSAVTSVTFTNYGTGYDKLLVLGKNVHKSATDYQTMRLNGINSPGKYAGTSDDTQNMIYVGANVSATSAFYAVIYDANQDVPHSIELNGYLSEGRGDKALFTESSAVTSITIICSSTATYTGTLQLWGIAG